MTLEQKIKEALEKEPDLSPFSLMRKFKITYVAAVKFMERSNICPSQ